MLDATERRLRRVFFLVLASALTASVAHAASQGFGAGTPGGAGKPVYRVTNRKDSGAGSLRDAVSAGNRHVVFDVSGTIALSSMIVVRGAYLTIDGDSAPSPGITLVGAGLDLDGSRSDLHDVIVRGIRIRDTDSGFDGLSIRKGAHHVLVERVSVDGSGDGNLDVTYGAHDVTVAWSVFSGSEKNSLIKYDALRVTLHHNVFVNALFRNPWISQSTERSANLAPDTTVDMRNNLVWGWGDGGGGTGVECGAKANLVANFYSSPKTPIGYQENAILLKTTCSGGSSGGLAYTSGNLSADPLLPPEHVVFSRIAFSW
jgi:large repetitive protein